MWKAGHDPALRMTVSAGALLFLVTGVPKLMRLEASVGLSSSHEDVMRFFESYLDAAEPSTARPKRRRRPPDGGKR